jgi:hypothetical protein
VKYNACNLVDLRWLVSLCGTLIALTSTAQTINVGSSGTSAYVIGGSNNPTLRLERGVTYVFQVIASGHPFYIKTIPGSTGTGNQYTSGVTGNGVSVGSLTFAVPTNAPNPLYYHCGQHSAMGGMLVITNPIAPPTVKVVYINVGSFITVRSTGTNGWSAVPEFKCGLASTNWGPVANFTNAFTSGTNTTTFNRLDAVCGSPNVFLRIRNQKN